MIDVSIVMTAIEDMLKESADLTNKQFTIERTTMINGDYGVCPWVGIYKGKVLYSPRSMGVNARNWQTAIEIRIAVQSFSEYDGVEAEKLLEGHVRDVLNVIESDRTLKKTVDMINAYEVEYQYHEDSNVEQFFQQGIITINAEVKQ